MRPMPTTCNACCGPGRAKRWWRATVEGDGAGVATPPAPTTAPALPASRSTDRSCTPRPAPSRHRRFRGHERRPTRTGRPDAHRGRRRPHRRVARPRARWSSGTATRAERAVERLQRVSKEAAAQSRRPWLAEVVGVLSVAELAELAWPAGSTAGLAWPWPNRAGRPVHRRTSRRSPSVPKEVGTPRSWPGTSTVGLGPRVLRAETAAVAAGVLLCGLRDGIVGPAPGVPSGRTGPR